MANFKTEQENCWAGNFGNAYIERNLQTAKSQASRLAFWSNILTNIPGGVSSCLEFGPNIGLNLNALGILLPELRMTGVEINEKAAEECAKLDRVSVCKGSILEFETKEKFDLTFTCGVLIHIQPESLPKVYEKLYEYSNRYIVISEYYNPTPTVIEYRGHSNLLFKRDFAGELLDKYKDLRLLNYGFSYHRDNHFPGGDGTWFIMEKS
ncbi:MAG: pseudaminic acid biosynthesis-associated methylase [Selenomonadaceae bacterium]|nr:pseudaminic acid biosynthesis-associated methylase [Selenomonadaceae bacterium]